MTETYPPNREGLMIEGWRNGSRPTLGGRALPLLSYEISRSLAIAPDAKRFFLGSGYALRMFDDSGAQKWSRDSRGEVWGGQRQQGRENSRSGLWRRDDSLASRRRRARAAIFAGTTQRERLGAVDA
jgi:hypothetical protein